MKKPLTVMMAIIACVAIVVSCVFGVQKGNIQKAAETARAELQQKIEDLEAQAATARETLENTRSELQGQLDQMTEEKAGLEKQMTDQAEAAKTELETKLSEAADLANAQLEAAKAGLQTQIDELTGEKAELEQQLTDQAEAAKTELEDLRADMEQQLAEQEEAARLELEAAKTELEAAKAELEKKLTKTERDLTAARSNAYLMYVNGDWSIQNWGTADSEDGSVIVTPAAVTGEGEYTIGLEFPNGSSGLLFAAIGINNGEIKFPGYCIRINAIRVNGVPVETGVGYTSSDDRKGTRMNIFNEWVAGLPADARVWDDNLAEASSIIVDKAAFDSVETVDVDFSLLAPLADQAYILYADEHQTVQNFSAADSEDGRIKVTAADIIGTGTYTVGLEFTTPAKGLSYMAVEIPRGEIMYPGYYITLNSIRVNGEEITCLEGTQGYTTSENQTDTRMNILDAKVARLPEDARVLNGDLSSAAPVIVDAADFESVENVEVTFTYSPVSAYLMFANSDWSTANWEYESTAEVKVITAPITGEGTYTVGLEFAEPSEGLEYLAVGMKNGETVMPGVILQVTEVRLNDGDNILNGITYTDSDDGMETRTNIYNKWEKGLPADARTESGDMGNVQSIVVDPDLFTEVTRVEVTFRVIMH